ncbi:ribose 5-phosphate isomerase B [Bacteroidia bacterium]|nr:ribose 5-phosphate isomerase B [Bacteroidia bacterium]
MKKIGFASDHAGYELKEFLVGYLDAKGYDIFDFGCHSVESCDYPDMAHPLAEAVADKQVDCGIAICGSGIGMSIAINRHRGVRGSLCWEVELAALTRQHNDSNVLVLPARFIDNTKATQIVDKYLSTAFEGDRHIQRVAKIELK